MESHFLGEWIYRSAHLQSNGTLLNAFEKKELQCQDKRVNLSGTCTVKLCKTLSLTRLDKKSLFLIVQNKMDEDKTNFKFENTMLISQAHFICTSETFK